MLNDGELHPVFLTRGFMPVTRTVLLILALSSAPALAVELDAQGRCPYIKGGGHEVFVEAKFSFVGKLESYGEQRGVGQYRVLKVFKGAMKPGDLVTAPAFDPAPLPGAAWNSEIRYSKLGDLLLLTGNEETGLRSIIVKPDPCYGFLSVKSPNSHEVNAMVKGN